MKRNPIKTFGLGALISCGVFAAHAGNGGNGPTDAALEKAAKTVAFYQDDIVKEIMKSIPSPVELSSIMKELNTEYSKADLSLAGNSDKYKTEYKQALNLGVYGADLGYASIYKKRQDALSYLSSVQKLSKELSLGNLFDSDDLKESTRMLEHDSLVHYATIKFDEINDHLVQQGRQKVSIMMLTGSWVEALYLAGKVYEKKPAPVLKEKIGEQKYALDQIITILNLYSSGNQYNTPEYKTFVTDMNKLKEIFDTIEVKYTQAEGGSQETIDPETGLPTFTDGQISEVLITDDHLKKIKALVGTIRGNVVQF